MIHNHTPRDFNCKSKAYTAVVPHEVGELAGLLDQGALRIISYAFEPTLTFMQLYVANLG